MIYTHTRISIIRITQELSIFSISPSVDDWGVSTLARDEQLCEQRSTKVRIGLAKYSNITGQSVRRSILQNTSVNK